MDKTELMKTIIGIAYKKSQLIILSIFLIITVKCPWYLTYLKGKWVIDVFRAKHKYGPSISVGHKNLYGGHLKY